MVEPVSIGIKTADIVDTKPANTSQVTTSTNQNQASEKPVNRQNNSVSGIFLPTSNTQKSDQQYVEEIKDTVANLNHYIQRIERDIHFGTHEATGRTVITVTDSKTGEEIRQIPLEELLIISARLAESLEAMQEEPENGLLFDTNI